MVQQSRRAARLASPRSTTFAAAFVAVFVALGAFGPREARAASFAKGPYLQGLGQTEVTIQLELAEPPSEPASVEIIGPHGERRTVTATATEEPRAFQAIRVSDLSPATSYRYTAIAGGARSEEGQFVTAPPDNRPFRFVLYGDSRTDHVAHAAVIRAIEAVPSDFLLHTGDMVAKGNNPDDWRALFDAERDLLRDRCVFASVGNHELTAPDPTGEVAFLRYFGGDPGAFLGTASAHLYRSFRWSNTRFFLLNAMDSWTGEERRWLREELSRADDEPGLVHRVAVLHHGPFSSGPHGGNKRLIDAGVLDLFREHRVGLVVAGHDHDYERGEGQGVKYIVSGGAGAPLYKRKTVAPEAQTFEAVHHFVEVAVDGDRVQMVARRASGSVIELCSFQGLGPWSCEGGPAGMATEEPSDGAAVKGPAQGGSSASSCACVAAGAPAPAASSASSAASAASAAASSGRDGPVSPLFWACLGSVALTILRRGARTP